MPATNTTTTNTMTTEPLLQPAIESSGLLLSAVIKQIRQIIVGKPEQVQLAVTCIIASGHLLIEDQPGVGKTTLAHTIAQVMGLAFRRIQFTSDLLPADILGVSIFNQKQNTFSFHPGPIFSHFVLADEINRATPKTQSALLEAMEEQQVSIEGECRTLPSPFFVVATQNPSHQIGTYALPESQLDRFLMRLHLGYPDKLAERELLTGADRRKLIATIKPVLDPTCLNILQQQAAQIHASAAILDYLQAILEFSRQSHFFEYGLSPRGGLAILRAAKALALIGKQAFVIPEHIKSVLPAVVNHRLPLHEQHKTHFEDAASCIIDAIPVT